LVEQWTENPCVPGSIPGGTTKNPLIEWVFFWTNFFNTNIQDIRVIAQFFLIQLN
jgi:hypothetical protein